MFVLRRIRHPEKLRKKNILKKYIKEYQRKWVKHYHRLTLTVMFVLVGKNKLLCDLNVQWKLTNASQVYTLKICRVYTKNTS